MDTLSPLLDSLRVQAAAVGHFDFGLPWCFAWDYAPAHCLMVLEGRCWWAEPDASPGAGIWLEPGDALVVLRKGRYTLGSAPGLARLPWGEVWEASMPPDLRFDRHESPPAAMRLSWNAGVVERTQLLTLAFGFEDGEHHPLLASLPDRLRVPRPAHASPWTASALGFLGNESGRGLPGFAAQARRLAELLLNDLLRRHLLSSPAHAAGWLQGLTDPALARALFAMHRKPGQHWTLARLAQQAGLSRTVFSERFLARVGETPMRYLLAWRMHCARDLLARQLPVGDVAARLGYASERAFRQAFKRLTGTTPMAFARQQRRGPPGPDHLFSESTHSPCSSLSHSSRP
ncbi:AraC family transcriptional regulator [Pelomonas sp. KK5]|uniref:AraC family transcriptional regulator n=1 Tax=Pelomonas sp. KK5 TaxID=1855730 RepID=UPI00097BD803|nr:AraC family transcriptional regulator [Pelomonas sp. KK5]